LLSHGSTLRPDDGGRQRCPLSDAIRGQEAHPKWSTGAIRDLGLDPTFTPLLATPVFPSYPSGHSTYSAAAAEVLAAFFRARAGHWRALAAEAGQSRIYGGIHFPSDNTAGLALGAPVGRAVVADAAARPGP